MKRCVLLLAFFPAVILSLATSSLWGSDGDVWDRTRVYDWSYAGYKFGEVPLPTPAVDSTFSGASDGTSDVSTALQAAIDSTADGGVLSIPAGTYKLSQRINLTKSVILRGAGSTSTIFDVDTNLAALQGVGTCGGVGGYSYCGGFFQTVGSYSMISLITDITAAADRWANVLSVADPSKLSVGQVVVVWMQDDAGSVSLRTYLGGQAPANPTNGARIQYWSSSITAIDSAGKTITLQRPIPFEIRLAWSPQIRSAGKKIEELGVEHLTVRFPAGTEYLGHHLSAYGYNAFDLTDCRNCWVRSVRIINAENGIIMADNMQGTILDVYMSGDRITSTQGTQLGFSGHHGIQLGDSSGMLVMHVHVDDYRHVHTVTVGGGHGGLTNTITGVTAVDFSADHHGNTPTWHLFDNITTTSVSRLFVYGGGDDVRPAAGVGGLFWNVRTPSGQFPTELPQEDPYPQWNLTIAPWGTNGRAAAANDNFVEYSAEVLTPVSLYEAQVARRLGSAAPTLTDAGVSPGSTGGGGVSPSPVDQPDFGAASDSGASALLLSALAALATCLLVDGLGHV